MAFNPNIPVVDIFAIIVDKVRTELLPSLQSYDANIETINYQFGHPLEIVETLSQYDKDPAKRKKKFPLIMLVQDFPEVYNGGEELPFPEVTLRIIIAYHTKAEYKAAVRYEKTFKPVLYPILKEFMRQIEQTNYFYISDIDDTTFTKTDRLYWGKEALYGNTANIAGSYLDAIEISNFKLRINQPYCKFPFNP